MHVRCPHCHQPVELVETAQLEHIDCPSCGSQFNLLGEETVDRKRDAGRTIGHFELVEQLGMGQFGTVWMARDTELDRKVAVKIPRQERLSPGDVEMFLREARAAAQLRHPNIVGVHEVGRDGDTVYIVSDLVRGATLADRLTAGRMSPREAAQLCATIADGLHHAHQSGVIHRDLKPSNIMLDAAGQPHLMDFGLAKRQAGEITMTMDGRILGTPAYMSPEQARGESQRADARSDIYSLGAVLFELLTGDLPFRGNIRVLLSQIINDEPPSPRGFVQAVPQDLETIVLKCLEKAPERRYASAREVAEELRHFLAGEPIRARPVGGLERSWRWCRRKPLVASLLAAIAGSLLFGAFGSTYFAVRTLAAKRLSDRYLYIAHMSLLQNAWEAGQVRVVRELLDRHLPKPGEEDLRNFEWFYWDRFFHSDAATLRPKYLRNLRQHKLLFRADGKRIAWVRSDGQGNIDVATWDLTTAEPEATWHDGHGQHPTAAFTAEGRLIAAAVWDRAINVWDVQSEKTIATLKQGVGEVRSLAISQNGARLACGYDDGAIAIWNVGEKNEIATFRVGSGLVNVSLVAFSPDGSRIVAESSKLERRANGSVTTVDHSVTLWNVETKMRIGKLDADFAKILHAAFTPDGTRIAVSDSVPTGVNYSTKLWDVETRKPLASLKTASNGMAFSPDGTRLASRERVIKVWDVEAKPWYQEPWQLVATLIDNPDPERGPFGVTTVVFSPDGTRLAAGGLDGMTVKLWNVETGERSITLKGNDRQSQSVAFSPDGSRLAAGNGDRSVTVRDLTTGEEIAALKGHSGIVAGVAFSPDGKRLVSGSFDKTLKLWDLGTRRLIATLTGHTDNVSSVAFSPDGTRIASGGSDGATRLWDTKTAKEIATFRGIPRVALSQLRGISSVAFSPDGSQIVSGGLQGVELWNTATRRQEIELEGGKNLNSTRTSDSDSEEFRQRSTSCVAFSPDGSRIAAANAAGGVRLWDAKTGTEIREINGHSGAVTRVAFSADGTRIATGSTDGIIKLWDAATYEETIALKARSYINDLAFSPDGRRIASAHIDTTLRLWDARPWTPEWTIERDALARVRLAFEYKKMSKETGLEWIAADQTISEPVRQRALKFAGCWKMD